MVHKVYKILIHMKQQRKNLGAKTLNSSDTGSNTDSFC